MGRNAEFFTLVLHHQKYGGGGGIQIGQAKR
jgi:hypothetical protein